MPATGTLAPCAATCRPSCARSACSITGLAAALAAAAIPFAAFFSNTPREVVGISAVLLAYLIGLVPFSALFLVQRTFYALGDTPHAVLHPGAAGGAVRDRRARRASLLPPAAHRRGHRRSSPRSPASSRRSWPRWLLRRRMGGIDGWRRAAPDSAVRARDDPGRRRSASRVLALLGGFTPRGTPSRVRRCPELIGVGRASDRRRDGVVYLGVLDAGARARAA